VGIHEICFNKADGTLAGLVTIELGKSIDGESTEK
jgi:hypothetical protein